MLLRPSAAHRWWRCSASISATRLPDALPEEDQDAAREGTCAAWVAECVINGDASSAADMLGRSHENGWEVDDDMVRHVQEYMFLRAVVRSMCETNIAFLSPVILRSRISDVGVARRTTGILKNKLIELSLTPCVTFDQLDRLVRPTKLRSISRCNTWGDINTLFVE